MMLKNSFKKSLAWCLVIFGMSNVLINNALAQPGPFGNWHMGRWMMGDWGMGWFGMMMMFLFWGLVIVGIVSIVRWLMQSTGSRGHSGASTSSQAMNILKERFARGELTRDQFESMKKEILQ